MWLVMCVFRCLQNVLSVLWCCVWSVQSCVCLSLLLHLPINCL